MIKRLVGLLFDKLLTLVLASLRGYLFRWITAALAALAVTGVTDLEVTAAITVALALLSGLLRWLRRRFNLGQ